MLNLFFLTIAKHWDSLSEETVTYVYIYYIFTPSFSLSIKCMCVFILVFEKERAIEESKRVANKDVGKKASLHVCEM